MLEDALAELLKEARKRTKARGQRRTGSRRSLHRVPVARPVLEAPKHLLDGPAELGQAQRRLAGAVAGRAPAVGDHEPLGQLGHRLGGDLGAGGPRRAGGRRRRTARLRASSRTKSASPASSAAATSATSVSTSRRRAKCSSASMGAGSPAPAAAASDRKDTCRYDPDMVAPGRRGRLRGARAVRAGRGRRGVRPAAARAGAWTGGTSSRSAPSAPACCPRWAASAWRWSAASTSWSAPTRSSCPARPTCTATPRSSSSARCVAAHARGARLVSICSGAFVLAGDRAARRAPRGDPLALRARCWRAATRACGWRRTCSTSTATTCSPRPGTAAGIDLCLHLVRRDHGADVANRVARRMVVAAHRDGGQAQFIDLPVPARPAGRPGRRRDGVGARRGCRSASASTSWPATRTSRRASSAAASATPPAPARAPGCCAGASTRRCRCSSRRTSRSSTWRRGSASPPRRRSGATSRAPTACRRRPGAAASPSGSAAGVRAR